MEKSVLNSDQWSCLSKKGTSSWNIKRGFEEAKLEEASQDIMQELQVKRTTIKWMIAYIGILSSQIRHADDDNIAQDCDDVSAETVLHFLSEWSRRMAEDRKAA